MAEAVIGSIARKIVDNLVPQALENVGNLWGVKHELRVLREAVSMLLPVLDDAEEQYYRSPEIRLWLEKLKDAFYDAQDVLEELNIEVMRRELRGHNEMMKEVRKFFSSSNQLVLKPKMNYKLRALRKRIEDIIADTEKFHLDTRMTVDRDLRMREESSGFISGIVIGRDDDKRAVKEFLLDSNMKEHVSILSIVGIGGLGKTALAQLVYNDEMVSKHFPLKMWVCVSDNFDMKKIITDIIACAKKEAPGEFAMDQLQSELRREIEGKRYLLVLDDLWNEEPEKWLSLKDLLVGGVRGSKILITTHLHSVAKITSTAPPHLLGSLSNDASLNLLLRVACQKEEETQDTERLTLGKEIARKCFGVLLVIRTVGNLLFFKKTKHEWLYFKDHELPEVSLMEDSIKSVLMLSYNDLPSHLKQCFVKETHS